MMRIFASLSVFIYSMHSKIYIFQRLSVDKKSTVGGVRFEIKIQFSNISELIDIA